MVQVVCKENLTISSLYKFFEIAFSVCANFANNVHPVIGRMNDLSIYFMGQLAFLMNCHTSWLVLLIILTSFSQFLLSGAAKS